MGAPPFQQMTKEKRLLWEPVLPRSPKFKLRPLLWAKMRGKWCFFLNIQIRGFPNRWLDKWRWRMGSNESGASELCIQSGPRAPLSPLPAVYPWPLGPLWNHRRRSWWLMLMVIIVISSLQSGSYPGIPRDTEYLGRLSESLEVSMETHSTP